MKFGRSLVALALLGGASGVGLAQSPGSIELFKEAGFKGESRVYYSDAPQLKKDGFGAVAKSARVRGAWTVCRLSEFKGGCSELRHDEPDLAKVGLADAIMSARPSPVAQNNPAPGFADGRPNGGYRDDRDRYDRDRPAPGSASTFAQIRCRPSRNASIKFADVTGDGRADAIVINENGISVRRSTGSDFARGEPWTEGGYYGEAGTFFVDVTGDGRADAIVVNRDGITVRRSDGRRFLPNEKWAEAYYGNRGTPVYFADVTGDGLADAIVINEGPGGGITVRRSNGSQFLPNELWRDSALYGAQGTFFVDLNGDRRADLVVANRNSVAAVRATGDLDGPQSDISAIGYYGSRGTFFADVTGDGLADGIVVNDDRVTVRRGKGPEREMPGNEAWTEGAYYGEIGTYFADVTGDGKADAIVVNNGGLTVRRSDGSRFGPNETWTREPFYGSAQLC